MQINNLEKKNTLHYLKRDKILNKENNPVNQRRQHSLVDYQSQNVDLIEKVKVDQFKTLNPTYKEKLLERERAKENTELCSTYGREILDSMMKKDNNDRVRVDFITKHEITSKLRAKMVDWMIEVMASYKCQE